MTVSLYSVSDDNAVVSKTLGTGTTLAVLKPTAGVNMDIPTIEVQYNTTALTANYAKLRIDVATVPVFTAYYFIKGRDVFPAEKIQLHLELDPLMTYAAGIRQSKANVIRSQSEGISYVRDDKLPVNPIQFTLHSEQLRTGVFTTSKPFRQPNFIMGVNTSIAG